MPQKEQRGHLDHVATTWRPSRAPGSMPTCAWKRSTMCYIWQYQLYKFALKKQFENEASIHVFECLF